MREYDPNYLYGLKSQYCQKFGIAILELSQGGLEFYNKFCDLAEKAIVTGIPLDPDLYVTRCDDDNID